LPSSASYSRPLEAVHELAGGVARADFSMGESKFRKSGAKAKWPLSVDSSR